MDLGPLSPLTSDDIARMIQGTAPAGFVSRARFRRSLSFLGRWFPGKEERGFRCLFSDDKGVIAEVVFTGWQRRHEIEVHALPSLPEKDVCVIASLAMVASDAVLLQAHQSPSSPQ